MQHKVTEVEFFNAVLEHVIGITKAIICSLGDRGTFVIVLGGFSSFEDQNA